MLGMNSGIYLITCTPPGGMPRYYVGQSVNVAKRLKSHQWALKSGSHHNDRMQRSWNKYGPECFSFLPLEPCADSLLNECEQWWLDEMVGRPSVFNLGTTSGSAMRGVKFSPGHRAKISEALTGIKRPAMSAELRMTVSARFKGKPKTAEEKRKNSESQMGERNHMFGRKGASNPGAKSVEGVRQSDGHVIRLGAMADGDRLGFLSSKISQCCNGIRPHHKGYVWRLC